MASVARRRSSARRRPAAPLRGLGPTPGSAAANQLDELKVKTLTIGALLAGTMIVGSGAYLLARGTVRDIKQNVAEKRALESGTDAGNYAYQFKAAFNPSGFESTQSMDGTWTGDVMSILRSIPSKAVWRDVVTQYSALFRGRSLTRDLADELTGDELREFTSILTKKPE